MTPEEFAATHAAAFDRSRPWEAQEFSDILSNKFTHVFGDARCFAIFQVIANEAELLTIATHPDEQRRGLGRACMDAWHAEAKHLGATSALLDVASDNHAAIALYTACGYKPCGLRQGYYRRSDGEIADAILMECSLS